MKILLDDVKLNLLLEQKKQLRLLYGIVYYQQSLF